MTNAIIQQIKTLFAAVDARDWQTVRSVMADSLLLDYSSVNGIPATVLSPEEITNAWSSFLPGFDRTQHQVSDFAIHSQDSNVAVHFKGNAQHWISDDCWLVTGTYDITLSQLDDFWLVTAMKFSFESQSSDTTLPSLAQGRMKK